MNMSERIAFALAESGRSPRELSKDIGVSVARISQLKSGSGGIKAENLFALARATGFSPQWIADGTGLAKDTHAGAPDFRLISQFRPSRDGNPGAPMAFDRKWLQSMGFSESALEYAYLLDGTMEPSVIEGDLVLIDTDPGKLESGGIYLVARSETEAVIKRFLRTMTNGWIIRSDNENKRHYPDETVDEDGILSLKIAGRVVWRGGKI
jgi:phage repressor protein C with HTH and peptisase S24 domain